MEAELRGEQLKLVCDLSTGSRVEVLCHVGHDVAYAKGQVARQTEIDAQIPRHERWVDMNIYIYII